jgi:hypothetical protein
MVMVTLAICVVGQEFAGRDERQVCMRLCNEHVSNCLEPAGSACQKVYEECQKERYFVGCLQSANSLQIQQMLDCFNEKCFYPDP